MPESKYKPEFVVDVYLAAKSGMTETQISKVLGISVHTLRVWEKKKKAFKLALDRGRAEQRGKKNSTLSFQDYIYEQLSYKNRKLWKKINSLHRNKKKRDDNIERIEALLEKRGKHARQSLFMHAWVSSNFSISKALRKVNISRSTFELWKKDTEFHILFKEMEWHKKNFFEEYLCKIVKGGNPAAIIFANKTYNRDRGYGDKLEVDMNLSGELDANVISVDTLNLNLETRKALLKSSRKKKAQSKSENSTASE
jgi:transposase